MPQDFYSPYRTTINHKDKIITINYTEHIFDGPGIAEEFARLGKLLAEYIDENGLKKRELSRDVSHQ